MLAAAYCMMLYCSTIEGRRSERALVLWYVLADAGLTSACRRLFDNIHSKLSAYYRNAPHYSNLCTTLYMFATADNSKKQALVVDRHGRDECEIGRL